MTEYEKLVCDWRDRAAKRTTGAGDVVWQLNRCATELEAVLRAEAIANAGPSREDERLAEIRRHILDGYLEGAVGSSAKDLCEFIEALRTDIEHLLSLLDAKAPAPSSREKELEDELRPLARFRHNAWHDRRITVGDCTAGECVRVRKLIGDTHAD